MAGTKQIRIGKVIRLIEEMEIRRDAMIETTIGNENPNPITEGRVEELTFLIEVMRRRFEV